MATWNEIYETLNNAHSDLEECLEIGDSMELQIKEIEERLKRIEEKIKKNREKDVY